MEHVLKFCKMREVISPSRSNSVDAGIDFRIPASYPKTEIKPNESILIPSGIKVDVPEGWALIFMNKSGIAAKRKLLVGAQVIDTGYQGECHINLHNVGSESVFIEGGEKIVQGIMIPIGLHNPKETPENEMWLDKLSTRGAGGFGSTGS